MRNKTTILVVILAIMLGFLSQSAEAQNEKTKYYIVFDNFESDINIELDDGSTIPMVDYLYYQPVKTMKNFGPYAEKKPFSPATFAAKEITDYDVAVFPMGDMPLHTTVSGIKVIDKVNEMLDAGKGVIIIGRNLLTMANQDNSVSNLFFSKMRLDYEGRVLTSEKSGNETTFKRFDIRAQEGDPVGAGYNKVCNSKYQENNSELAPPFMWYESADFFQLKESSSAIGFDKVVSLSGDWYAGARYITGSGSNARLVFWSVGFDVATKIHSDLFGAGLKSAVEWCAERLPKPEQYIEAELNKIDFEAVRPGDSVVKEVRVRNSGRETLTITKTEMENFFSDEGIYTVVQNKISPDNPVTLDQNDILTFKIKFKPDAEKEYQDALIVHSDAINSKKLTIELSGTGGEVVKDGPYISEFTFPIDFGTVKLGKVARDTIDLTNSGNQTLIIQSIKFIDDANKTFDFDGELSTPQVVQPGKSFGLKIKFFPVEAGKVFEGQIKVASNAANVDTTYIDLIGKSAEKKKGPEAEYYIDELAFGDVVERKDTTVWIKSVGDENLLIASVGVEGNNENKQAFEILSDDEGSVAPGDSFKIDLSFQPLQTTFYFATLTIITNGKVYDNIDIPISGNGLVSVKDGKAELPGIFSMNVSPNPVNGSSVLEYNIESNNKNYLELKLIDGSGNIVHNFKQGVVPAGTYQIPIKANNFSSGSYFIIADIGGKRTTLPVVIAK